MLIKNNYKKFLIITALIGSAITWALLGIYFYQVDFQIMKVLNDIFPNWLAASVSADLLIASLAFLVGTFAEFYNQNKKFWILILLSTLLSGLALAIPVYFLIKFRKKYHP